MLRAKGLSTGALAGVIYDFESVGDELPMHIHTKENNHISVVARGSIRAFGNGWERVCKAGDVIDWRPNDPHGFAALEANTRVVNIVKGGGEPGQTFLEGEENA